MVGIVKAIEAAPNGDASATSPPNAQTLAPDVGSAEITDNQNADVGRSENISIKFADIPPCKVAVVFNSLELGWEHIRAIVFPEVNGYDELRLRVQAGADMYRNNNAVYNSDTKLRYAKISYFRASPGDLNFQTGRVAVARSYPDGKQLTKNVEDITFEAKFSAPEKTPKVLVWVAGIDYSEAKNWRLKTGLASIKDDSFSLTIERLVDTILYKTEVCWIAISSQLQGVEVGRIDTAEGRSPGWAMESKGSTKFQNPFQKPPNVMCGLSGFEMGCGRGFRVRFDTTVSTDGFDWRLWSAGDSHFYSATFDWLAYDSVHSLDSHKFWRVPAKLMLSIPGCCATASSNVRFFRSCF